MTIFNPENEKEISKKIADKMDINCETSKIALHKCSVKTMYGWCCDLCLEAELLFLKQNYGISTVGSCCGHNELEPFIQVYQNKDGGKMEELGYKKRNSQPVVENGTVCYLPKTKFLYEN